ncbi:MAG TPA: DUF3160 domain-containing protein, partial [Cyanophyceae cyanobacterium]
MTETPIAKAPDDVFGYMAAFEEALKKIGQISPQEFAKRYASRANYLSQISFDPTTAGYWDEFNLDPQEHNKNSNRKNWRSYDFRLNSEELAVFKNNGFVVSERMGSYSFAHLFYRIYSNDLPVFISADALLHAWHRSYDAILSELEESYLACALDEIFKGMVEKIPDAWKQYGDSVLGESVRDADYFLAVARSLLGQAELSPQEWQNWICPDLNSTWKFKSGFLTNREGTRSVYLSGDEPYHHALKYFTGQFTLKQVQEFCQQQLGNAISPTFVEGLLEKLFANDILARPTKAVTTYLNQDDRLAKTMVAIASEQRQCFSLFGRVREVDFSQFKVRGHYENSERLKKYFRAIMWCGRIDLRIAEIPCETSPAKSSPRELGAAIVLYDLVKQSGKFEQWQQFDQLLQTFVGRTDSMTFAQLGDILDQANIKSPAAVKDLATLEQLQADILASKIGFQDIRSHYYESPFGLEKVKLPRSFTILGQKFVLDSWVTSKVVFDDILWDEEKVQRRV